MVVAALLLGACAGGAAEQPAEGEPPTEAEDVTLVDWGFTGDTQDMFREELAEPFMEEHPNVTVELLGGITEDALAQIRAAQGASPIDTMLLGESRYLQAQQEGWLLPVTEDEVPNIANTYESARSVCEPEAAPLYVDTVGILYNPDLVPRPESWDDLWSEEYEGMVGIAAPSSNAGYNFLMLVGNLYGEGESDTDTIWQRLDELSPFTVASNPEALAQLLEREEIGAAVNFHTVSGISIGRGYDLEYVLPSPGAVGSVTCYGVLQDTAHPELAQAYLNMALDVEFQTAMSQPPNFFAPVNRNVEISEESAALMPSPEEYPNLMSIDWGTALGLREDITARFIEDYGQ